MDKQREEKVLAVKVVFQVKVHKKRLRGRRSQNIKKDKYLNRSKNQ